MISWLKNLFRPKPATRKSSGFFRLLGKFDAAGNEKDNRNHWLQADSLSPNAAVSPEVRKRIRERARYEVANNSVAFGIATTRTNDLVGSGPRPCVSLPEPDTGSLTGATSLDREQELADKSEQYEALIRIVEDEWAKWCRATRFAEMLRIVKRAELIDGECFALVTSNPKLNHPVKLQLRPFEADRVCDPTANWLSDPNNPNSSDGITFDTAGNPVSYTVLRQHPGDTYNTDSQADEVSAENIFHFFRVDRPGQTRGVSWLTPCLELFAMTRRHSLAVLSNAEIAANYAVLIKQSDDGFVPDDDDEEAGPITPYTKFDVPRGSQMALPPGAEPVQLRSEHATTAYGEYRRELLNEIGRCLDMPLNVVQGNSSQYNFASAKIDHTPYHRKLGVEREADSHEHLDRLFHMWLDEAVLVGLIPDGLPPIEQWTVEWYWDGFETGNPVDEAKAIEMLLALNLTTLAEQGAAKGLRWQDILRQRKREQDFAKRIGLVTASPPAPSPSANGAPGEVTAEEPADE